MPKTKGSPKAKRKVLTVEALDDKGEESADDDILVISTHKKAVKPVVDLTAEEKSGDRKKEEIVVVDEGYELEDLIDDDVDLIDLSDSHVEDDWFKTSDADDDDYVSKDLTDEALNKSFINTSLFDICIDDDSDDDALNRSFINTSLFNICVDDEDGDNADNDDRNYNDEQPDDPSIPDVEPTDSPVNKWLLCMDTLETNRDLAWDNLTFKLMNTMPLMMVSASVVDNILDISQNNSDAKSDSSFEPISSSDTSSYDNLDDICDDDLPLIPEWFFNPDYQPLPWDDFSDDFHFESIHDNNTESTIPDWLYDTPTDSTQDSEDFEPMIPNWLYDPNHSTCEETAEQLIPDWLYDPTHSTYNGDLWDESDFSESEWESDYTDESEDDDDGSSVVIPEWLFGERKKKHQQQDDDSFLFSQLFVDVPTFIILLFLTTALGFSIGHGKCHVVPYFHIKELPSKCCPSRFIRQQFFDNYVITEQQS